MIFSEIIIDILALFPTQTRMYVSSVPLNAFIYFQLQRVYSITS